MNKRVIGLAAVTSVVLLGSCGRLDHDRIFRDNPKPPTSIIRCVEDDECWDCNAGNDNICQTEIGG